MASIHRLKIPLGLDLLDHVNLYLFVDHGLLIDVGPSGDEAYSTLTSELEELGLKLRDLKAIIVTHAHIDHVGMWSRLVRDEELRAQLMIHPSELASLRNLARGLQGPWARRKRALRELGVPREDVERMELELKQFTPAVQGLYEALAQRARPLKANEEVVVGGLRVKALWTPGHSQGHLCIYERGTKALALGDHVLPTITPNVSEFEERRRPKLMLYLDSLSKLKRVNVNLALPGHGEPFNDLHRRVDELQKHHFDRAERLLREVQRAPGSTAYELASKLEWDVPYSSWEAFPAHQKYLAVGEAHAHLRLLEHRGLVEKVFDEAKGVKRYLPT